MKYENYITIQGWMVSELKLSGNNLLTFALIYGFCQDGESEFKGSINYICKWLNCSRPTAIKSLKYLCENNLIIKTVKNINDVNFNRYKVNLLVVKKLNIGSKETLLGSKETLYAGSKETLPNNNILDNNNDKNKIYREFYHLSLSEFDFNKLINLGYTKFQIDGVLDSVENYNKNKNYTSLYLTAKNWLEKRFPKDDVKTKEEKIRMF